MYRYLRLFTFLLLSVIITNTQAFYSENFENGLFPDQWITFENGNGNLTWDVSGAYWTAVGRACMCAEFESSGGINEKWLVMPQQTIEANESLVFMATDDDEDNYGSELIVLISTSTDPYDTEDYAVLKTVSEADISENSILESFSVDLSAYQGSSVYIAFLMRDNDGDSWYLDQVSVGQKLTDNIEVVCFWPNSVSSYPKEGETANLTVTLFNNGSTAITDSRTLVFKEGTNIIDTKTLPSIQPGETIELTTTWTSVQAGLYNFSVEVGSDDNSVDNKAYINDFPIVKEDYVTETFNNTSEFPPEGWSVVSISGNEFAPVSNYFKIPVVLKAENESVHSKLISPKINISSDDLLVLKTSLWNPVFSTSQLIVQYSEDNISFTNLDTIDLAVYEQIRGIDLSSITTGNYFIALDAELSSTCTVQEVNLLIDDFCSPSYWVNPGPQLYIKGSATKEFNLIRVNENDSLGILLKNSGSQNLTITGTTVNTPFLSEYSGTILPGESDTAWVVFQPSGVGVFNETISFNGTFDGTKTCALKALSYPESYVVNGFEEDQGKTGWMVNLNNWNILTYQPYAYEGQKSAVLSNNLEGHLVSPEILVNGGDNFYFYARWSGVIPDELGIYYTDDPLSNKETWTLIEDILPQVSDIPENEYGLCSVSLPVGAQGKNLIIYAKNGMGSLYIDKLVYPGRYFDELPLCTSINSPSDNEVNVARKPEFSWEFSQDATSYKLYLSTSADPVQPDNLVFEGNENHYVCETGLDFSTEYFWTVVPVNSVGDATACSIASFTTVEDPSLALPFNENFNGLSTVPVGWTSDDAACYALKGMYSTGLWLHQWKDIKTVILPPVGPVTNNTILSFDYRWVSSSDPKTPFDPSVNNDKLKVLISTNFGDTYTDLFTLDYTNHTLTNLFSRISIPLGGFSGESVIIKLVQYDYTSENYSFDLDNFSIKDPEDYAVSTFFPDEGLYLNEGETGTFIIYVSNDGSETDTYSITTESVLGWDYDITNMNDEAISSISLNSGDLSAFKISTTLPGDLNYGMSDSFHLNLISVANSSISSSGSVKTYSIDEVVPTYYESFDSFNSIPPGWSSIVYSSWSSYFGEVRVMVSTNTNDHSVYLSNSNDKNADLILISPKIASFENTRLRFKANAGMDGNTLIVGTISDPENRYTFNPLKTITLTQSEQSFIIEEFAQYTGDDKYFAIKHGDISTYYSATVDDIYFEIVPLGPTTEILPTSLNIEPVWPGDSSEVKTINIKNIGNDTLYVNEIVVEGIDADEFSLLYDMIPELPIALVGSDTSITVPLVYIPKYEQHNSTASIVVRTSVDTSSVSITANSIFESGVICETAIDFEEAGGQINIEGKALSVSGEIINSYRQIWIEFEVPEVYDSLIFSTCGSNFDTQLEIYQTCDGEMLYYNDDSDYCTEPDRSMICINYLAAGTYLARIRTDYMGSYTFTVIRSVNTNSSLSEIKVDNVLLDDFSPETFAYDINKDCSFDLPIVTAKAAESTATVTIVQASSYYSPGNSATIRVVAENEIDSSLYQLNFLYPEPVSVTTTLISVNNDAITISLDPAIPELDASNMTLVSELSGETDILSVTELNSGGSYEIHADMTNGLRYQFTVSTPCFDFGEGISFIFEGVNSIKTETTNSINLYPNPANDIIHIECDGNRNPFLLQIINIYGEIMSSRNITGNITSFDVSGLPDGMYFFRIKAGHEILSYRVTIQ